MKKLLYTLSGSLIIFAAVFAVQDPLTAAEKKVATDKGWTLVWS